MRPARTSYTAAGERRPYRASAVARASGPRSYHPSYARYYHPARHNHYYCHDYYWHGGFSLSFTFGAGWYLGFRYYYPFHHYYSGCDYAFFYSAPLTWCYVPYGFYVDTVPVYIDRTVYVREDYPIVAYETAESGDLPPPQAEEAKAVDPQPAAPSPSVERYLREASEAFKEADYASAAEKFRLAAIAAPDQAGPLFALGQALLALGDDAYAARVVRQAVTLNEAIVREPGDIVGVYRSQEEFDRVMAALEERANASEAGSDARFLLGVQRYFVGDPQARESFAGLAGALPGDPAVAVFSRAVDERFRTDLPPVR